MAASYPGNIKTWTPRTDGVDDVMAADINSIYEEVTALETYAVPNSRKVNGEALSSDITLAASDIPIADNGDNFTATHVEGALAELFTSVSNGKTALVSDIEDKGGTVSVSGDIPTFGELSDGIGTIPTGGGGTPVPVSPKDVNFYDYDGTIVESYTLAEAQALSALPTAPDHSNDTIPLTFQEWNYTLEQVKALTEKADIRATYIPTDGKTHLKIRIAAEGRMVVPLYFSQTVTNGVTIDWGDGSSTQKLTGTGNISTTHTYSSVGDYDITLAVESGCVLGLGSNSSSYCVLGATGDNGRVYCNMLQEVNVGERVTSIGIYAFRNCYSLASITIPNSVTDIGTYAFQYCYSLASITISNGVTSIGNYAFRDCYSLASITIPNSVTSIGTFAFQYCYSLASITIPNSVTSIGNYAFRDCRRLASITIPNSVTSIGEYAFYNCYSLASITIPNSVTSIGEAAFYNCCSLASITIPNSVTSIETYAFWNCYSLASITIPNSVDSIGDYAFGSCYSLASITIPNSVTSIEDYAFRNCYGMAIYDFSTHTSVPTLASTNAFNGIPSDCIMKIPSALFATWKTATSWSTYASKMVAV
jgi:hypothetical protein